MTQARTGRSGLVDQLYNPTAICGIGHFSSSPQIAWTFFRSASNAAVSAKAASLRRNSRSSSRMRLRSALVASDCRAAAWSDRSLACSQLARQRRICSGYRPRRRQYSASSSSVRAAVSSTALNFCWELQPSVVADALGNKRPALRACLRQLYIVAVEMPSSAARSLTVRLYGASSLAKMASRRSGEYFMGTFSLPQVGDSNSNICRGSNYSDSGGIRAELMRRRHQPVPVVGKWLRTVVQGYFAYYAVPTNLYRLDGFRSEVCRAWRHALKRRSQRNRQTWDRFNRLAIRYIPHPRQVHPYPERRFYALYPR